MISVATYRHLGDSLGLMCAIANARLACPELDIRYCGGYPDILLGTDIPATGRPPDIRCHYMDFGASEQTASTGTLCSGLTDSLARHLGREVKLVIPHPPVKLCPHEFPLHKGAIVVNTNCQSCSTTKGYPRWREVLEGLEGEVVLMGGREERDIREDFKSLPSNVLDLRGATSVRDLFRLVAWASCIVTPPSGVVHLSAGFGTPCVVLSGAREPVAHSGYPNTRHLSSCCPADSGRGRERGCMIHKVGANEACGCVARVGGRDYAACMAAIRTEDVIEAVKEHRRK